MMVLHGVYNPVLVALSIIIAVLSSFTALNLVRKIFEAEVTYKKYWLLGGSIVMGVGIWAMHFIGMLAYSLPIPVVYGLWMTLISLLVAVAASWFALYMTTRNDLGRSSWLMSGIVMGCGIASMHYLGMMAIVTVAEMHHQATLVILSIVVAVLVSMIALKLAFYFRSGQEKNQGLMKFVSAIVMGLAISSMHYIGMAAMTFMVDSKWLESKDQLISINHALDPMWLSIVIASAVLMLLAAMFFTLFITKAVTMRMLSSKKYLIRNIFVISALGYGAVFWLLEVMFHAYVIGHNSFMQEFTNFDPNEIWMRVVIIITALGFGMLGQRLFWIASSMNNELILARDDLESTVTKRTAELSESEERVRSVLDTAYDGFVAINSNGRIIDWNLAAGKMFGWERFDVIGRQIDEKLFPQASRPISKIIQTLNALVDQQQIMQRSFECQAEHKNGSILLVECGLSTLRIGTGIVFNVFIRDITLRKQHELELKQARDMADQANRMKSEFLANMSHELRTPLNAIMGFAEVLKDNLVGELNPDQHDYICEVFDSSEHLLSLINDILDLSKVEAGKMKLELETVNLQRLLKNSLSIVRERANNNQINIESDIDGSMGNVLLDERKTKQIIFNLLSNAVKFTPDGGTVTLKACIHNDYLQISVIDTGIGISKQDQDKLFKPFQQIDGSMTRQHQGSGLGLSLSKSFAELHGGNVRLESTQGKGSCFTVELPCRRIDELDMLDKENTESLRVPHHVATGQKTILIIEDSEQSAALMMAQLKNSGYRTMWARNGLEGIELAHDITPDMVLLDIMLPDLDGWSVLAQFKVSPEIAHIPVMIVSIVADAQKGLALGAVDVMEKPLRRELLLNSVKKILTHKDGYILVIDDDANARELVACNLEPEGINIRTAESGIQGLQIIEEDRPALVILDLMMPEMSGFDVLATLRSNPETVDIPVLVLTAQILSDDERQYLENHSVSLVQKNGTDLSEICSQVQQVLDDRSILLN